jgi:hypothetical protein
MRKNAFLFLTVILAMLSFSGCSDKVIDYNNTFFGQTDRWKAEIKITGQGRFHQVGDTLQYDGHTDRKFTLTYLGDLKELSNVKKIVYSYKSSAGDGGGTEEYNDSPPSSKVFTLNSSSNGASETADETIHVIVELDGIQTGFDMTRR